MLDIIAETATEYFKQRFSDKDFDSNPWNTDTKKVKTTGSLLVDSGAMLNSIRPAIVSKTEVVISAGDSKVDYAQVHNEGFVGNVTVPAHTRKGHAVKSHTRAVNIPQRQFMGNAKELVTDIMKRIEGYIRSIT